MRTVPLACSVLLFAALLQSVAQSPEGAIPAIGSVAPDFTLKTPEGKPVELSSLRAEGPLVLVILRGFPGYQCPYCHRQAHDFEENAARFAALHAQVLLVYPGPPAKLEGHANHFLSRQDPLPPNVHLVIDPDYAVTNQYGVRWHGFLETAYPSTFLLHRNGTVFFEKISHSHGDRSKAEDVLAELNKGESRN